MNRAGCAGFIKLNTPKNRSVVAYKVLIIFMVTTHVAQCRLW